MKNKSILRTGHKITVSIKNGTITINQKGNKHEKLSENEIIDALRAINGVSIDESGKMLFNGKPVTDVIEVHYKPNDH